MVPFDESILQTWKKQVYLGFQRIILRLYDTTGLFTVDLKRVGQYGLLISGQAVSSVSCGHKTISTATRTFDFFQKRESRRSLVPKPHNYHGCHVFLTAQDPQG